MLDKLLEYHQTPGQIPGQAPGPDTFVADVMKAVAHQQRRRKLILIGSGVTGGLFGVAGATLLSDSVGKLITQFAAGDAAMPFGLAIMAAVALLGWLMQDETRMSV